MGEKTNEIKVFVILPWMDGWMRTLVCGREPSQRIIHLKPKEKYLGKTWTCNKGKEI